jgi:hypothetical protein
MKTRASRLAGAIVLGLSLIALAGPAPALAEERTCRGEIGQRTVDNLRVPDGATCTLRGTTVKGTIKVESRATLLAYGVRVVGNVQGENAQKVLVAAGSRVGGSVHVVQGRIAKVVDSRIVGNILFDENRWMNTANRNVVNHDVQVFQNTGGARIHDNRIDGNLQCKQNHPRPVGSGNVVQGNKEDQCRSL